MMISNGNGFRVTGPLWGEPIGYPWFPSQTASNVGFGVFFDVNLNKQLYKQSIRRYFDTSWYSL